MARGALALAHARGDLLGSKAELTPLRRPAVPPWSLSEAPSKSPIPLCLASTALSSATQARASLDEVIVVCKSVGL